MLITISLILLLTLNALALFAQLLSLPGNWLMVVLTWLYALWKWDQHIFSLPTLIVISVLALVGELLESLTGAAVVRRTGGTHRAMAGAVLGAFLGAVGGTAVVPVIGSIIGACLGAFAGALAMELSRGREIHQSLQTGLGAGLGHFVGMNLKLLLGATIWIITALAAFHK